MKLLLPLIVLLGSCQAFADEAPPAYTFKGVSYMETAGWLPDRPPDARFTYGEDSPQQFADLRLPAGPPPPGGYPVIIFIHGGAWRAEWSKDYSEPFAEALSQKGYAVWDLEFQRIGNRGGGFPGTFEDIADGTDYLRKIADTHELNLSEVIAVGHSSGGHLALWLGGRHRLSESSTLYRTDPLALAGIISIAGVNDLELSLELGGRTDVLTLIDAQSEEIVANRFAETNPSRLRPFGIPQTTMIGDLDGSWRLEMTERDTANANAAGDEAKMVIVPGANHFDVVDPRSGFANAIAAEARLILSRQ